MAATRLTVSVEERKRSAELRLGQLVLGKWRLERLIGLGGMAAVFEAVQRNGHRVAIKVLHADLASSEEIRERFLAEGYIANRVAHPGVVAVRDEGTTDDGAVFLVMDLLRGQTLAERLQAGLEPFNVGEVLDITSQLLDVLVHAHDRGIVHRDIKPENVFLTTEGRARLLDFGLARVDNAPQSFATEAGSTLGTPAFMPPEQALGDWSDLDGRSDLWSLAATMYLLLSGCPVRERGSATQQLLGAMTRPVPSLGDVTTLPRSVVAVVDRALAFDRDNRFPDARSMQLAVRAVRAELGASESRAPLPPPSVEPMALSIRDPRSNGRKRPSIPTMRPVAASATPLPSVPGPSSRSGLAIYVGLGFAVGISIVMAARFTVHASPPSATAATGVELAVTQSVQPPGSVVAALTSSVAPAPSLAVPRPIAPKAASASKPVAKSAPNFASGARRLLR